MSNPISIIDLSGKVILKDVIENGEIEIELKASGSFLIHIGFGKYSISKKLINGHW